MITQLLLAMLIVLDNTEAHSSAPYISDFEYSPEFHPSRNPSCPRRWARGTWKDRRSPDEGEPVGQEPSIEIRAILVRCPKSHEEMVEVPTSTSNMYNITAGRSQDILEFHGFDRDEPSHHSEVKNCRRKLIVTMKFNNIGKTRTQEEFVVVDHVLDPVTMHKARLLNPFVFKVRQEQVLQLYALKFQSVVNGEAKEEVINKKSSNYTGCDDSSVNPTCGQMMFHEKAIPYSQGFCCSCDPDVNAARQPTNQRRESLSLGNMQKIIPDRNKKQTSTDVLAPLFASQEIPVKERFLKEEKIPAVGFLSKKERSLKSSQIHAELSEGEEEIRGHQNPMRLEDNRGTLDHQDNGDEKMKEINFREDYPDSLGGGGVSPALRDAMLGRNPSKGKIEPYIDAVKNEGRNIIEENGVRSYFGGDGDGGNVDADIFREFKQFEDRKFPDSYKSFQEKYPKLEEAQVPGIRNSDLTAELVELEKEYKALKKSKKNIPQERTPGIFKNHSQCKDFRKLARGPDKLFQNPGSLFSTKNQITNYAAKIESGNSHSSLFNVSAENSSTTSRSLAKASNLHSSRSGPMIRTISSNDTKPIFNPSRLTTYPTLILRQELVNDKLHSSGINEGESPLGYNKNLLKSSESNSRLIKDPRLEESLFPQSSEASKGSGDPKSSFKASSEISSSSARSPAAQKEGENNSKTSINDKYADLVIKYGKMHSNKYINSEIEEPLQKYDLDLDTDPDPSTNSELSQDSLSHIADKVLKEFESAENDASLGDQGVQEEVPNRLVPVAPGSIQTLNNPGIVGSFENLGDPSHSVSAVEQLQTGIEEPSENFGKNEIHPKMISNHSDTGEKLLKIEENSARILSSEIENPGKVDLVEKLSKKLSRDNSTVDYSSQGKIGDAANPKYSGESPGKKTMIEPAVIVRGSGDMVKGNLPYQDQSATVIADRRFDEVNPVTDQDYLFLDGNGKVERHDINLRENSNSDASSLPRDNGDAGSQFLNEKFNRLDDLVRGTLRSRRRAFRSVNYDDPFHRGNDEKQEKIDRQIEEEFSEITEALNESSDKNIAKISSLRKTDDLNKNLGGMLNGIRKNAGDDFVKNKVGESEVKRFMKRKQGNKQGKKKSHRKMIESGEKNEVEEISRGRYIDNSIRFVPVGNNSPEKIEGEKLSSIVDKRVDEKTVGILSDVGGGRKYDEVGIKREPPKARESVIKQRRNFNHEAIKSSTRKYPKVESKTNINEILKEIIKNDYGPSLSGGKGGRQKQKRKHLKRRKNKIGEKTGLISSPLKSISQNLHVGKLQKKCPPVGTIPLLRDDEKDNSQTLPPDESTLITTSTEPEKSEGTTTIATSSFNHETDNSQVEDTFNKVESTLPPEETTSPSKNTTAATTMETVRVNFENIETTTENSLTTISAIPHDASVPQETFSTGSLETTESQNHGETTSGLETTESGIFISTKDSTTPMPSTLPNELTSHDENVDSEKNAEEIVTLSSSKIINDLKKFSAERRFENLHKSNQHTVIKRSPINSEGEEFDQLEATTWVQNNEDYNSQSEKSPSDVETQSDPRDSGLKKESSGTQNPNGVDDAFTGEMMPTTLLNYNDNGNGEYASDDSSVNGGGGDGNEPLIYEEGSPDDVNDDEIITVYEETTNTEAESITARPGEMTTGDLENYIIATTQQEIANDLKTTWRNEENDESFTFYEETTISAEKGTLNPEEDGTTKSNQENNETFEFHKKTTSSRERVTENEENDEHNQPFTVYEETTNSNEENTESWVSDNLDRVTGVPEDFTTYSPEITDEDILGGDVDRTTSVVGSSTQPGTPEGFGEMPRLNNTGGESSIILVKTYSVSQNPREFLDNYEFPVGVKKVLLKRLNVTALIHDPVDLDRSQLLAEKINDILINGKEEEDTDESEDRRKYNQAPDEKSGLGHRDYFSSRKNRRTVHQPNIDDLKIQQFQQDSYKNMQLDNRSDRKYDKNNGFDLDLMGEASGSSEDEPLQDYGLKFTRSFTTLDTLPPDDETTHFSLDDNVNATNSRFNYIMEEPIFAKQRANDQLIEKNEKLKSETKLMKSLGKRSASNYEKNVEFYYDYDLDSNFNEVKRFHRSPDFETDQKIIENREHFLDDEKNGDHMRLEKRETKEYSKDLGNVGTSVLVNRGASCSGKISKAEKIPEFISPDNSELENDEQSQCGDSKWQGKIDLLKLKKHQDILKEYLNWRPNVDTTVMRIFSIYSTPPVSLDKHDSSTMSILLIEDDSAKENDANTLKEVDKSQLEDKDILDKLRNMPSDDNLMIISVNEKNKLNITENDNGSMENIEKPKILDREKRHRGKMLSVKPNGDGEQRRNIKFSQRKARTSSRVGWKAQQSGRRLMSAVQLSENKDNGLRGEEHTMPEENEEVVEKYEAEVLPGEYEEDLVPRNHVSRFHYLQDNSYDNHKRDELKSGWNKLVDKIVVNKNDNDDNFDEKNSALGSDKSSMEKLHFFNADKYIKLMAKKINRLSNVDNTEHDLTEEKKNKKNDDGIDFNYEKVKNYDNGAAFAGDDENQSINYDDDEMGPQQMENSAVNRRKNFIGNLGNDFDISISGKVHINGELSSENEPMSVSIEGMNTEIGGSDLNKIHGNVPSASSQTPVLGTNRNEKNFRSKEADHFYFDNGDVGQVFQDEIPANSYDKNKKDIFFGESGTSASPNISAIKKNRQFIRDEKAEIFKDSNTPKRRFYNVVLRAHPRYEKWPVQSSTRDFIGADEPSEDVEAGEHRDGPENEPEKIGDILNEDEPVFDFAKLELRQRKPSIEDNLDEIYPKFREERAMKIVNENKKLLDGKPVELITSELPKMDFEPSNSSGFNRTKIKPVRHTGDNLSHGYDFGKDLRKVEATYSSEENHNFLQKRKAEKLRHKKRSKGRRRISEFSIDKNIPETEKSGEFEPQRAEMFDTASPIHDSKTSEQCFGEKEVQRILEKPYNTRGKNISVADYPANDESTKIQEEAEKPRLSTDDLRPSSAGKTNDVLINGVEISSPGENPASDLEATACSGGECQIYDGSQDSRKAIQLENLMRIIEFAKKLEEIIPGSRNEILESNPDPETVVEVESVLLVPQDSLGIGFDGYKGAGHPQGTYERVVEIGEGVKHNEDQTRHTDDENSDVILPGNPEDPESLSNFNSGISHKGKSKSSMVENQPISDSGISASDVNPSEKKVTILDDENGPENGAAKVENLFKTVKEKIEERLSELHENGASSTSKVSTLPLMSLKRRNEQVEVISNGKMDRRYSPQKNLRSESNLKDIGEVVKPDDVLNLILENRLNEGKTGSALSRNKKKGFEFEGENESPYENEVEVRIGGDDASNKPQSNNLLKRQDVNGPEKHKIANILDKVASPKDLERKERQLTLRESRTPSLTYAVGVSEIENGRPKGKKEKRLRSMKNGGPVQKEKRSGSRNSKSRQIIDSKNRRKRKHRRKKKNKKSKKKEKRKKKKWWFFKRNILTVSQNEKSSSFFKDQDKLLPDSVIYEKTKLKGRKKRQIKAGGSQVRGGQDCMDRRHPPHVNSAKYQESAHCLRFSDLWYSVYELETPIMEHTVYLQLFEKHTLPDGTTHWDDLTQGSMVRLGTFVRHQRDAAPTISFTYTGARMAPQKQAHNLDPSKDRLLVPSPVAAEKVSKYPEVKGGSGEYLVVQSNAINKESNDCDKAGVGFQTFANQPNRCGHQKGTCLKNQPLAYWRHDVEAREAGRRGCYFLSNFASVPNNPIKYNVSGTGSREYLGLEYHSPHVSAIDIEVRADYNAIVRVGSSGRVTEVYVDSTAPEHTIVTIVISNMGLASSPYQSRISDCPTGLPVSWSKAKGAMQVIPPQHDQRITLDLYGQLFINGFHCSVEVVNHRGELVAMRRIRVQKMDRCFCVWHCLCSCIGSVSGLGCQPMSPEHYHAAGFQGPVPIISTGESDMVNSIEEVIIFSGIVVMILLGLGMLKWLIGIFLPVVSRWGLDILLPGNQMLGYFESELRCRSLMTDFDGKIVHPDTGKKSVRICSRRSGFFLNLIFFLTYPIAVCCNCARSSLANRKRNCCEDESKECLLKAERTPGCERLICVNTYGDNRNSKLETEDTRYVLNELKRSRDSLQDGMQGGRCKVGLRNRK